MLLDFYLEFNKTFFSDRGSFDQISLDIFTWSNFSIKRLKIDQLIELFDQLIKKNWRILAVDRIFFKA